MICKPEHAELKNRTTDPHSMPDIPNSLASPPTSSDWIFQPGELRQQLALLGFLPDLIDHLNREAVRIGASPALRAEYREAAEPWLTGTQRPPGQEMQDFDPLIVVAGFPKMLARHRDLNIPFQVTQATALDLQRWMAEFRERTGKWEFQQLGWFFNHVHRDLLEIGRLQYLPAPFGAPFRIYQRTTGDEIFAFPEAGKNCSDAGWFDKGAHVFETTFEETGRIIVGNPVDLETGQISRQTMELVAQDFHLRLAPGMPSWQVHIPSGSGLTPAACADSLHQAAKLFEKCFPEMNWKAFCCTSWLLDRELGKCLPPDSNIVAFGRRFLPLAKTNATPAQLFERVFGGNTDWKSFQPRTKLQCAIIGHLANGGKFRETGGVILTRREETAHNLKVAGEDPSVGLV